MAYSMQNFQTSYFQIEIIFFMSLGQSRQTGETVAANFPAFPHNFTVFSILEAAASGWASSSSTYCPDCISEWNSMGTLAAEVSSANPARIFSLPSDDLEFSFDTLKMKTKLLENNRLNNAVINK